MTSGYLLEICVESVAAAEAAERGGANRIELCSELRVRGLTPRADLMRDARERVRIPIHAMIRPRDGDFFYSDAEFAAMKRDLEAAKRAGMDGAVLGIMTRDGRVDVGRTRELVELAHPLPVTFHRAFDECADLMTALEEVIRTRAARILTSGGKQSVAEGLLNLAQLVKAARGRIVIVPGGGVRSDNVARIVRETTAPEFHSALSGVFPHPEADILGFETEVRKLAAILAANR